MTTRSREQAPKTPAFARAVRRLAVPIVVFWTGLVVVLAVFVPSLGAVEKRTRHRLESLGCAVHAALKHTGKVFNEFDTDSAIMIVLEGDQPLGDDAHHFYDRLVQAISNDKKHVQHVQDFWGDSLTAAGSQSPDGKAAYVQVYLSGIWVRACPMSPSRRSAKRGFDDAAAGSQGLCDRRCRGLCRSVDSGRRGPQKVTTITFVVIFVMLLWVYRSIVTVALVLFVVGLELMATRGAVAFLACHNIVGISTFAANLLVLLAIAASTDYAIFVLGRYQEVRGFGEDKEKAFYTMFRGTGHVVLGSGLTIAGSLYCLSFTRLPYFQTLGGPCAVGMLVAMFAAMTLCPAVLVIGSSFRLFDAKRTIKTRGWRRVGTAIVRWPGPILIASIVIALIGLVALPGYKTKYESRKYLPATTGSNIGYAAEERHFSNARMNPELLLVETDHDLRNPAGMLVLDRIARAVFHIPGVARVQSITRPLGAHSNTHPFRF